MGVANNTRKIFMGGRRGAAARARGRAASRAAKQGRPPPPPRTKKAPTPPKKAPTAAKKAKTNAKQAQTKKDREARAKKNREAGLKRQAAAKKEKAAGTFKRKSKSEKKANKATRKTAKKTAKAAKKNPTKTKKNPTKTKKNPKKGAAAPSFFGGPLGALGDVFKGLAAGLAAAAEAAAAAAGALADALSGMFSGASDLGEGFGPEGASSGANISGSNSNGNCSPEAQAAKSNADQNRLKALEKYDPIKSGSLKMLIDADKVWKAAMMKAKITGTCEGDSTKNAENSPKNSPKEPEPSIVTAKDMDDNTFAKAWAGSESILGLVPPIKSTDKFKSIQGRIMNKIKTKSSDSDEHIQARKEMYIASRFILDPANIYRKFRKPSVLNAKVGAQANTKNSGPVNSSNDLEPNTNSKYMTQGELKNLRDKSIEFINNGETIVKVGDSISEKIIKEIPIEDLKKMSDVNLANLIKTKLYDNGLDDNDKVWPDNFSKFWADAEYILGFKIKESDTYYDIQKKVSLRRKMFSNEIYEKIKYAIELAEIFITEHHYFSRKFRKQMYVGNYKNTIHKTKEQINEEMSYLKGPPQS